MDYQGWERDYLENKDTYDALISKCILAGEQDVNTEFLDKEVAEIADRKYAVSCSNATDALVFALQAYNIGHEDEVIVPDFSWISTASVVNMVGATPVFCDINVDTHQMMLHNIKKLRTDKTKAVIYPCLFGAMFPEIFAVAQWCLAEDIIFIEDSAQALGVELNGRKAGSIGDISVYSFNDNKVIAGFNGGGAVMTDSKDIASTIRKLACYGRGVPFKDRDMKFLGRNSKMYLMNAHIISHRLKSREKWQKRRQEIAKVFDEFFADKPVVIQEFPEGLNHNYHKYVVRFLSNAMRDHMKHVCGTNIHYADPISHNSYYMKRKPGHMYLNAGAEHVADTIMTIPCHAWMTDEEIDSVCDILEDGFWKAELQAPNGKPI
jgi:dTDP-4-amino-4,6-dideoxygalactose transaminase